MIQTQAALAVREAASEERFSYPFSTETLHTPALDDAFPSIDPQYIPFGERVLVQMQSPRHRTAGGILLTDESKDIQKWNVQVGKVLAMGECVHVAATSQGIKRFDKLQYAEGDFVRTPLYGGDKWSVVDEETGREAIFQVFKWYEISGKITGNPLNVKVYVG